MSDEVHYEHMEPEPEKSDNVLAAEILESMAEMERQNYEVMRIAGVEQKLDVAGQPDPRTEEHRQGLAALERGARALRKQDEEQRTEVKSLADKVREREMADRAQERADQATRPQASETRPARRFLRFPRSANRRR